MHALEPSDLLSLEAYTRERTAFRERVIAHKKARKVHVGAHLTLLFEDRLTIQYQVQEILRTEKIFEPAGIEEELQAYNPLIPDGRNLKATLLIEYEDVEERKRELAKLRGIEHEISLEVAGHAPVRAIADEDLPRSNEDKTSAVHFLRFELDDAMIADFRRGVDVAICVAHPACRVGQQLGREQRDALARDFD
ncbi:MAG: DUF3501 family protein [Rhodanobacteraceae bacterium]